ncbi:hypothetical protein N9112_00420 [bacterium]|nr:hypothetical protein [bacterium]
MSEVIVSSPTNRGLMDEIANKLEKGYETCSKTFATKDRQKCVRMRLKARQAGLSFNIASMKPPGAK